MVHASTPLKLESCTWPPDDTLHRCLDRNHSCCCCSVAQSGLTLFNPMDCSTPGLSVSHHLLKLAQFHVHCIADAIQPSHPLMAGPFCFCPRSLAASATFSMSQLFAKDDQNTGFSFSISPPSECSGLISLKIDWFDLLAVQGTLRSLLQHHSSTASIPWHSAFFFFTVQLSLTSSQLLDLTPHPSLRSG